MERGLTPFVLRHLTSAFYLFCNGQLTTDVLLFKLYPYYWENTFLDPLNDRFGQCLGTSSDDRVGFMR